MKLLRTPNERKNENIDLYHGKKLNKLFFSNSLKFHYLSFGIGSICLGCLDKVLFNLTYIYDHSTERVYKNFKSQILFLFRRQAQSVYSYFDP